MKDVKYNLDPSVLLETLEKLKSDEEYGCSNLVGPTSNHSVSGLLVDFGSNANLLAEGMVAASQTCIVL